MTATVQAQHGHGRPTWVSVGGGCQVAHQLRRSGLRHHAMPLDWVRTPVASVHRLFATDFRDFLREDNLDVRKGPPRHLFDADYGIVLPHDLDAYDAGGYQAVRDRYAPRVQRLVEALDREAGVVLVRRRISEDDAMRLATIVQEQRPSRRTTVLAVNDVASSTSVTCRVLGPAQDVIVISTPPMGEGWTGSDLVWNAVLGQARSHVCPSTCAAVAEGSLATRGLERLLGADWKAVDDVVRTVLAGLDHDAVPDLVVAALIAAEDHRFFSHRGVDFIALARGVYGLLTRRPLGGGSTIEQQLYRVLSGRRGRTLQRKLKELAGARLLARRFAKRELAAAYLMVAYFGAEMNGLEQACERLRIDLSAMTQRDAASLVARLKYPEPRAADPIRLAKIERRTVHVQRRMQPA